MQLGCATFHFSPLYFYTICAYASVSLHSVFWGGAGPLIYCVGGTCRLSVRLWSTHRVQYCRPNVVPDSGRRYVSVSACWTAGSAPVAGNGWPRNALRYPAIHSLTLHTFADSNSNASVRDSRVLLISLSRSSYNKQLHC